MIESFDLRLKRLPLNNRVGPIAPMIRMLCTMLVEKSQIP